MIKYKNQTLGKYLDDLAAKLAAPGGGSAAALNAALGASLLSMVINFTLGKPKYARYAKELKATLVKTEKLRKELLNLVDLDVLAYKSNDARKALAVPWSLARLCFGGSKLCPDLIKKGNVNLASDVAVAAVFFESAFAAACFNVEINLKILADLRLTAKVKKEIKGMQKIVLNLRRKTEASYGKIIRG